MGISIRARRKIEDSFSFLFIGFVIIYLLYLLGSAVMVFVSICYSMDSQCFWVSNFVAQITFIIGIVVGYISK